MIHIKSKPEDEYDGIETYVSEQLAKKKTAWAPIENTMFCKVDKDEIDIDTKIDTLQEVYDEQISAHFENADVMVKKLDDLMAKVRGEEVNSQN